MKPRELLQTPLSLKNRILQFPQPDSWIEWQRA